MIEEKHATGQYDTTVELKSEVLLFFLFFNKEIQIHFYVLQCGRILNIELSIARISCANSSSIEVTC